MNSPDSFLMKLTLDTGVPLRIMEMERKGGPTDADLQEARDFSVVLGEKGDILQYGGGKPGEVASLMNRMIKAVAVLAFCPGGVRLFGSRYESALEFRITLTPALMQYITRLEGLGFGQEEIAERLKVVK